MRSIFTLVLLSACLGDGPSPPNEPTAQSTDHPIGICLAPDAGWPDLGYGEPDAANITGTLSQVVKGLPSTGPCADRDRTWVGYHIDDQDLHHGIISTDSGDWLLAISLPGLDLAALEGTVTVDFTHESRAFSASAGHAVVSVDDHWSVWVAKAGNAMALTTPADVSISQGAATTKHTDQCGSWHQYMTEVTVDGILDEVDVGHTAQVGPASVTVGWHSIEDQGPSGCADWFVAEVGVGGWRL